VTKAAVGLGALEFIQWDSAPPEQMSGEKSIHPQICMPWR